MARQPEKLLNRITNCKDLRVTG
ncbi:uncharacterized protein G2W53_035592 [Senna tora]|uniref:Uncharacterized protein n=1 Tax=Senna tora TaxID=362788 RepID=A0A834W9F8_9FABA|nr:uncharacterized protein G2W53_035592 [Senna tora]